MKCSRGRKRKAVILEPWYEEDDELREGYTVEHLLDKFIVTADYKKETNCDWKVGTELYLVAWQGYGDEENSTRRSRTRT